jgi:hypothetical protein
VRKMSANGALAPGTNLTNSTYLDCDCSEKSLLPPPPEPSPTPTPEPTPTPTPTPEPSPAPSPEPPPVPSPTPEPSPTPTPKTPTPWEPEIPPKEIGCSFEPVEDGNFTDPASLRKGYHLCICLVEKESDGNDTFWQYWARKLENKMGKGGGNETVLYVEKWCDTEAKVNEYAYEQREKSWTYPNTTLEGVLYGCDCGFDPSKRSDREVAEENFAVMVLGAIVASVLALVTFLYCYCRYCSKKDNYQLMASGETEGGEGRERKEDLAEFGEKPNCCGCFWLVWLALRSAFCCAWKRTKRQKEGDPGYQADVHTDDEDAVELETAPGGNRKRKNERKKTRIESDSDSYVDLQLSREKDIETAAKKRKTVKKDVVKF